MSRSENLSYLGAPMIGDYMYTTLPERLRVLAETDPTMEAFVYYDINWKRHAINREQFYKKVINLAKILIQNGLRNRANVGFCMSNSMNMVIANYAVICAGGVPFFMGNNLKDGSDVIETLNSMKCELFVVDTNEGDAIWNILENIWPKNSNNPKVSSLKSIICHGKITENISNRSLLCKLMEQTSDEAVQLPELQPEDHIAYFCTSGSTGKPKEVTYSHYGMFNWTRQSNIPQNLKSGSKIFNDRTFSWAGGYPKFYATDGVIRIFVDQRLTHMNCDVKKLCDVLRAENCDIAVIPGYIAVDLLGHPQYYQDNKVVKGIILAGERIPSRFVELKDTFCDDVYIAYGTTECGHTAWFKSNKLDDYEDGIIGTPVGGYEMKIVNEVGRVVPRGEIGELCVRSTSLFVGYRHNEELYQQMVDSSSWFHTKDLAHMREDGQIVIEGRMQEMISMHTNKYFPWPVENVLKKMPGLEYAFVVGVPDKRLNQVFCACVVPKKGIHVTVEDVEQFCDEQFLEQSSPMIITTKPVYHIVLQDPPLLATGKISRRKLAEVAKEQLGL